MLKLFEVCCCVCFLYFVFVVWFRRVAVVVAVVVAQRRCVLTRTNSFLLFPFVSLLGHMLIYSLFFSMGSFNFNLFVDFGRFSKILRIF